MALADNAGDTLAPNSLCTSPDARGSYSNTKTCRGSPYTYLTDGNADAAYTDSCSTNDNADAVYTYSCPTDGYASPTFADASANRYATGHTNRHTAAYTDKHASANGHARVDIGISEMDEQPSN